VYFDTHTHATFAAFGEESDGVIKRALEQDVWMANIGTSFATSKSSAEVAKKYPEGVYATVGLHPGHTWQDAQDPDESDQNHREAFLEDEYAALLNDKVVAVGEIGLDYYRMPLEDEASKKLQKDAFVAQLNFAKRYKLPVVIHCRDAYDDCLEILQAEYLAPPPHRGKRNEPAYVRYVVDYMAQVRWVDPEEMARRTFENACRVYKVKGQ
jgi:TatD DNase family protein